jgi:flagellar basal-body rod protein FlgG
LNGIFHIGTTGLRAQQTAVDITSNNLANVNTSGFKKSAVSFADLVGNVGETNLGEVGSLIQAERAASQLLGVAVGSNNRVLSQGEIKKTDNPLNLAIRGAGFFEVLGPGGKSYLWRGGSVRVNEEGYLSAANGMVLKPLISVPQGATNLTIKADGKVAVNLAGRPDQIDVGQIELSQPNDLRLITPAGDGLWALNEDARDVTRALPGEESLGTVEQGALETSNVSLTEELVNLLLFQRAFAANAKVIQAGDEIMSLVNNLKR